MSSEYWIRRVKEMNQKAVQLNSDLAQQELLKLYRDQANYLYYKIMRVFAKIDNDKNEHGKIYLNDLYRTNQFHVLLQSFSQAAKKLGGKQVVVTQKYLLKSYQMAQDIISKIEPQIGKMRPMYLDPRTIDPKHAIRQTWCLDGKNFSDRIWLNKNDMIANLSKHLQDNLTIGKTAYEISRQLKDCFMVQEYKAYRLARTEVAHAAVVGQTNKYKQMGFTHGIFVASDPCQDCGKYDGQKFTLDELQTMIPLHPNCQCSFTLDV